MSARLSKRASTRSSRSMPTSSIPRPKKSEITDLTSLKIIHRIHENQENLLVIYQIREELMKNVMDECYKNDIKKKTVSFVVQCAYKAIMRIIDLNFYAHDPGKNDFGTDPEWTADQAPDPSPADTWAAYNVPLVADVPESVEEVPPTPAKVLSQESVEISDYSAPCSLISEPYMSYSASDYSECLLAPNVSEEVMPESVIEEEDVSITEISKEISLFTKIATLYTEPTDSSRAYSDYKRESEKLPKIPKVAEDKKPKVVEVKISASALPPLRADTILQRTQSPTKIARRSSASPKRSK